MATLEPNGERGRVKLARRRRWVKPLVRPQTLKLVLAFGRAAARVLWLIYMITKFFRD